MSAINDVEQSPLTDEEFSNAFVELQNAADTALQDLLNQMSEVTRTEYQRRLTVAFSIPHPYLRACTNREVARKEKDARNSRSLKVLGAAISLYLLGGVVDWIFGTDFGASRTSFLIACAAFLAVGYAFERADYVVEFQIEELERRRLLQQWMSLGLGFDLLRGLTDHIKLDENEDSDAMAETNPSLRQKHIVERAKLRWQLRVDLAEELSGNFVGFYRGWDLGPTKAATTSY